MEFRRLTPEEIEDTILTEEPEDEEVFEAEEDLEDIDVG